MADAWGNRDPRPAEYVALLATTRDAILEVDPDATIIAAALAPTTEIAGRNISDIRFLDAMYQHGASAFMDVVAGKPYGFARSPFDREVDETILNFSRIIALREVMLAHDDGGTALWASNFGWNSLPQDWTGAPSIWGQVSADEQIDFALKAMDRIHREWPWLGAMILHQWQPMASASDPQWGFSLIQQDGSPSPLLLALQGYDHPQHAQNGLYHPRNEHSRYSGIWQFSELGADIGWLEQSDSQLTVDFFGTDIAMLLREDEYVAFLYPKIDGQDANATQRDSSGNAYVFLRSNSRGPETNLAPIARNLSLGPHTLHVVADRGWDRWAIAGYAVSSGNLAEPYERQITLGIVTSCLSLLVFLISAVSSPWQQWIPALSVLGRGLNVTTQLLLTGVTSFFLMLAMLWTWDSPRASIFLREDINIALALLTGGLLYLNLGLIFSLALALILFVLIVQRIESGLILTLLWAPFFLFPVSLHTYSFPMVEVMILITGAAGAVRFMVYLGHQLRAENGEFSLFAKTALLRVNAIDIAVLSLVLLGAISLLWTEALNPARTELRTLICGAGALLLAYA